MCWHNSMYTRPVYGKNKKYYLCNAVPLVLECLSTKLTDALSNGTLTETTTSLIAKADAKTNATEGIMGSDSEC